MRTALATNRFFRGVAIHPAPLSPRDNTYPIFARAVIQVNNDDLSDLYHNFSGVAAIFALPLVWRHRQAGWGGRSVASLSSVDSFVILRCLSAAFPLARGPSACDSSRLLPPCRMTAGRAHYFLACHSPIEQIQDMRGANRFMHAHGRPIENLRE